MNKTLPKICYVAIMSLLTVSVTSAQNIDAVPEKPITKQTIENQLNQIATASEGTGGVKMVLKPNLEELASDVMTLLSRNETDLVASRAVIEEKNSEIKQLHVKLNTATLKLDTSDTKNNTFAFFGMRVSKNLYHAVMWTLVLTLLITTVFLIVQFKKANEITKNSKGILIEVEDEFETFKRNAIEREQKLRRQLQDEIIKQKKLAEVT